MSSNINLKIYKVATLKLLIVALFFIAVIICSLSSQAITTKLTPGYYLSLFLDYIVCESYGVDSGRDCDQFLDTSQLLPIFNLSLANLFLESIIPLVIFAVNSNFDTYANGAKKRFTFSSK